LSDTSFSDWAARQPRLEGETTFTYRLRLKREWESLQEQQTLTEQARWAEFIPDLGPEDLSKLSPEQKALDDFIELISISDAYNQWTGKGLVNPGSRKDSIKVRCPNPAHPDNNPSAWINTEKNVFHCGACSMGGDVWDIAAWYFNFPVPGYKQDPATFRALREKIGEYFGMAVTKGIAGDTYLTQVGPDPRQTTSAPPAGEDNTGVSDGVQQRPETVPDDGTGSSSVSNVVYTPQGAEAAEIALTQQIEGKRKYPGIDWRKIVPPDTFLHEYLLACTRDDCPEEFHFWNGLMAVGLSAGRCRTLEDQPEVSPNLFVCLTGGSGTGKSKSKRHLVNVVHGALPYKRDDQPPHGAWHLPGIQSGEVLIRQFQHEIIDPVTNKPVGYWPNIRGLVEFDELASLVGKASRQGSTLKTVLMELFDCPATVSSTTLTHGNVEAEKPFGSCVTTTQYKSIRELITRKDDVAGFANRWVFATGVLKKPFSVNRIQIDLTKASGLLSGLSISYRTHELVLWDEDGEKEWDKYFHNILLPLRADRDQMILQRFDLLLKKLFLLFAMNERSSTITGDIVRRVLTIAPHLLETYGVVESEISSSQEADDTELVLRQVARMTSKNASGQIERGPTAAEIFRAVNYRISSTSKLRKVLENLVVLGLIHESKIPPGPKGGRPTSAYVVAAGVAV